MTLLAVACEGADVLALFDDDGTLRGEIAVGSHPVSVTTAAGRVFVATMGERSVTVVGRDGDVDRLETGVLGPAHFARTDDRLLVACTASDTVAVVDPASATLDGRVPTGPEPHGVGVIDDLALAGSRSDGVVTVFDPSTCRVTARHHVPDTETARLQGIENGPATVEEPVVAIVDQGNERVLLAGLDGVLEQADVGSDPYEPTVTTEQVFVASRGDDTVHEFGRSLAESNVHHTAAGPEGIVVVDGEPWVFHREAPVLASLDGRAVSLPFPSMEATVLPDGRVLLSHYGDHAVSLVDVETAAVEWTVETPDHPFGSMVV